MPSASGEPRRAQVRRADGLDLALLDQPRVGIERLVERRRRIVPVRLVKVERVDLQTSQRLLHRLHDVVAAQALVPQPHVGADLGRDDHVVVASAPGDPSADDRLGFAADVSGCPARVRVRRVDQVEAGIDEGVEQPERRRFVDGPAEDVAAECKRRDAIPRAAEWSLLHRCSFHWTHHRAVRTAARS